MKKTKIICMSPWAHHRGGWAYCNSHLYRSLNHDDGIPFYTNSILQKLQNEEITVPWIAFLHVAKADKLEEKLKNTNFSKSLNSCKGLYVLSKSSKDYVKNAWDFNNVEATIYPATPTNVMFDMHKFEANNEKRVIQIGHWMRNMEAIYELKTNLKKTLLNCTNQTFDTSKVDVLGYMSEKEYDEVLSKNLIFLNLLDAGANTTIVECIARNTPILVNRLPATEEYLGGDYPLLYSTIDEASDLINNSYSISKAHEYLKNKDKKPFTIDYFIESIKESKIYKELPYVSNKNHSKIFL